MGLFVCAKCECVENTALGWYWSKDVLQDKLEWDTTNAPFKGKALCSECAPSKWKDGKPTGYGKWHGKFEKEHYSKVDYQSELYQLPK